jgi:pimeloyl-ACP methyl ester carboxylesterase
MPTTNIRGVEINYELHGNAGPWIALSPGGRRSMADVRQLAGKMAQAGYRVVLHDRRNCGASDVSVEGEESEYEIWADDLRELLTQFNAAPAIIGGSSSGCRLSLLFALRHPQATRALMLWRVTGGPHASTILADLFYERYARAALQGGMAAVCEIETFKEAIEAKPANRDKLMAMDPQAFARTMSHWGGYFLRGKDQPVIGVSEADLRSIKVPTCIISGNDQRHPRSAADAAHRLIANSELHHVLPDRPDIDMVPVSDWLEKVDEIAAIFVKFLQRAMATA